jgi:hypothetical protein
MTGDQADFLQRLRAVLPGRWFPDVAPVLESLLSGLASGWTLIYGSLQFVRAQTRIATASGVWLDIIGLDFFGLSLSRRPDEGDASYRRRIQLELFRERGTRAAVTSVLGDLTGRSPVIFEPARTTDTGGYGSAAAAGTGLSYGLAGGWGSLQLPFQSFVTAYRPVGSGIALVSGWGQGAGGYGVGSIEYGNLDMIEGQVTDADVMAAVASVVSVASTAWVAIGN